MMAFVGMILIAGAAVALWVMLPKNGRLHRLATVPVVEDVIPFGIVAGLFVGLVLILAAL